MSTRTFKQRRESSIPDCDNFTTEEVAWVTKNARPLFNTGINWRFINTDLVDSIKKRTHFPHFILLKVDNPIDAGNFVVPTEPIKLPFCKIHNIHSASLLFGYLFEIPKYYIKILPNSLTVIRPSATKETKFNKVEVVFQNSHITVFYSEDGMLLACFTEHYKNLLPENLRGGVT